MPGHGYGRDHDATTRNDERLSLMARSPNLIRRVWDSRSLA